MVYLLVAYKTPASRLILHNSNSLGLGPSCRSLSDPDVVINMYRNSFPVSILFLNFLSFPMHEMMHDDDDDGVIWFKITNGDSKTTIIFWPLVFLIVLCCLKYVLFLLFIDLL